MIRGYSLGPPTFKKPPHVKYIEVTIEVHVKYIEYWSTQSTNLIRKGVILIRKGVDPETPTLRN